MSVEARESPENEQKALAHDLCESLRALDFGGTWKAFLETTAQVGLPTRSAWEMWDKSDDKYQAKKVLALASDLNGLEAKLANNLGFYKNQVEWLKMVVVTLQKDASERRVQDRSRAARKALVEGSSEGAQEDFAKTTSVMREKPAEVKVRLAAAPSGPLPEFLTAEQGLLLGLLVKRGEEILPALGFEFADPSHANANFAVLSTRQGKVETGEAELVSAETSLTSSDAFLARLKNDPPSYSERREREGGSFDLTVKLPTKEADTWSRVQHYVGAAGSGALWELNDVENYSLFKGENIYHWGTDVRHPDTPSWVDEKGRRCLIHDGDVLQVRKNIVIEEPPVPEVPKTVTTSDASPDSPSPA